MSDDVVLLSGSARRLAEELDEDGIKLEEDDAVRDLLLDELDYARRIPMFEGRRPLYGSFSMPPGMSITTAGGIADLVPLDGLPLRDGPHVRRRPLGVRRQPPRGATRAGVLRPARCSTRPSSSTSRRSPGRGSCSAPRCSARSACSPIGASSRGTARTGRTGRPPPRCSPRLRQCAPDLDPAVAHGLLDLAVHWLSPARVGATIVVHEQAFQWASMDVATKFHAPKLSITNRQHFPALFASLQQHDLATLVKGDGSVSTSASACAPAPRRSAPSTATAACATAPPSASATTTRRRRSPWSATTAR